MSKETLKIRNRFEKYQRNRDSVNKILNNDTQSKLNPSVVLLSKLDGSYGNSDELSKTALYLNDSTNHIHSLSGTV